jgi:uncharacterized protein YqeY
MAIIDDINNGIKEAIRSREEIRLSTLRMLKSKILAADARANLSDAEVIKLFKTYAGNLEEALEQAHLAQRADMADKLKQELLIVKEYLPKMLSKEETQKIVELAIEQTGATSKKQFGVVMKSVLSMNSSVDGKIVKEILDQILV